MGSEKHNPAEPSRPKKRFGQNFLKDSNISLKIVEAIAPEPVDFVLEIGPGKGAITGLLLQRAGSVAAVEIDRDLIPVLSETFGNAGNFSLIEADILETELAAVIPRTDVKGRVLIAANLPYYISTAVIQKLCESRDLFSSAVLMLQKEVAERILAGPGSKDRGFISVLVEDSFDGSILFDVPPAAFFPQPKVRSAVVRLDTKPSEDTPEVSSLFRDVISASFAQKRKTLKNNLTSAAGRLGELIVMAGGADSVLRKAGIDPRLRAEALPLDKWRELVSVIAGEG